MERPLSGRTVVVTGAARGLGASAALALAAAGARCILLDRLGARLRRFAAGVARRGGGPATPVVCDLAERDPDVLRAVTAEAGPDLAAFVHCAGVLERSPVEAMAPADWDRTLAVNLSSAFWLLGPLLAPLRRAGGGSIVLTSSRAGVEGFAGEAAYCASKFGLEGLSRALASELSGAGVVSNTITPGARIKPTGLTLREEARIPAGERTWSSSEGLGPAFSALAALARHPAEAPSGRRFRADRVAEAVRRFGIPLPREAWEGLAE